MKKDEAEAGLRRLCHVWRTETGKAAVPEDELYFSDYLTWVEQHHRSYLAFRSTVPAIDLAETWFDQEFHQSWRN